METDDSLADLAVWSTSVIATRVACAVKLHVPRIVRTLQVQIDQSSS